MRGTRIGSFIFGVACAGFVALLVLVKYDFIQSEAQLNGHAAAHLPKELKGGMTIESAEIDLLSDAADVEITATVKRSVPGLGVQEYEMVIHTITAPDYRFMKGAVHLDPREIEIVSIKQVGGQTLAEAGGKLKAFAERVLPKRQDEIDELAYAAKEIAPEVKAWLEGRAGDAATWYLERYPVYTLPNDWKGYVAQAVLDDIRIDNEQLIITVSALRLAIWAVIWSVIALVSLAYSFAWLGFLMSDGGRRTSW